MSERAYVGASPWGHPRLFIKGGWPDLCNHRPRLVPPSVSFCSSVCFLLGHPLSGSHTMSGAPIDVTGHFVHGNTEAPAHPSLMAMFSLKGKTAIVTGAAAGIGLAVADGLAEAGANVALWYNSNTKAHERAQEIAARYGVQGEYSLWIDGRLPLTTYSQGLSGQHHGLRGSQTGS